LEHLELDAPEALVIWAASAAKHRVAALAPLVAAAAGAGDRIAESLLDEAVEGLVELVRAVESALAPWLEPPEVALSGGLVAPSGPLRDRVEARIHEEGLTVSARPVDPAAGAAALALRLGSAATP
jgi:N-acetylglucosamine kinase-like BadF-type ATPase